MRPEIAKRLNAEISHLKEVAEQDSRMLDFGQAASDLYNLYCAFIDAGFTEQQAWEIVKISISKEVK